jgi:type IV secretory pathway VirB6-like protein
VSAIEIRRLIRNSEGNANQSKGVLLLDNKTADRLFRQLTSDGVLKLLKVITIRLTVTIIIIISIIIIIIIIMITITIIITIIPIIIIIIIIITITLTIHR